jgi:hypothetical protein
MNTALLALDQVTREVVAERPMDPHGSDRACHRLHTLHERGSDLYAFCTRAPPRRRPKSQDLALQSQADGGIRTHDPRFTRAVLWPTELRRRERPV